MFLQKDNIPVLSVLSGCEQNCISIEMAITLNLKKIAKQICNSGRVTMFPTFPTPTLVTLCLELIIKSHLQNGRGMKPSFWLSVTVPHSTWGNISVFSLLGPYCFHMLSYSPTREALVMSPCQDVSQGPGKLAIKTCPCFRLINFWHICNCSYQLGALARSSSKKMVAGNQMKRNFRDLLHLKEQ